MRLGVLIAVVLAASPAHAELRQLGPCLVDDAEAAVVVEATLVAIEQPAFRCAPSATNAKELMEIVDLTAREAPAPETGCLIIDALGSRSRSGSSRSSAIEIVDRPCDGPIVVDGTPRDATASADLVRICAIAPGPHVVTTCSARGTVRCELAVRAGGVTVVQIEPVPARVQLRIERVLRGDTKPGTIVTVDPFGFSEADRVELPARATYTWLAGAQPPRARVCERKPAPPGCSRCATAGVDPASVLVALLVANLLARRQR